MNNSTLKLLGVKAVQLLLGVGLALSAAAGCSASSPTTPSPTPVTGPCGNLPSCPANQACYQNMCVPVQVGSGGNANPGVGGGGNPNPAGAGYSNPGGGGYSNPGVGGAGNPIPGGGGIPNNPGGGGGSGAVTSMAGSGTMTGAGGSTPYTGPAPAGFWVSKDWHGCSWTGKGVAGVTTVAPQDFVTRTAADPFCISGTVGAEPKYESVALLGFNVNESNVSTCAYKPVDTTAMGPPAVTPTADGIAVNFVKKGVDTSFTLRLQIQGPNGALAGAAGAADRWCATITAVQGKVFVKWSDFTPSCWALPPLSKGPAYAKQPISAVVFSVPGKLTDTPYNFCVNGLAYGATAADAPDGTAIAGDQAGTIGGPGGMDLDFARAKVNVGGHDYIIQNNNWGSPNSTDLSLAFKNNSFKITAGSGTGGDAPASFPSIFIGNNGNTANGVFSTKPGDNLPTLISTITSIPSTFRYSGSTTQFNATYDIWFANSPPTTAYNDGIDGFVMIWLRDPGGKQPVGSKVSTTPVTIAGKTWDVWKGPRGAGPMGSMSSAPVVSFVNPMENDDSRSQNFVDVNIKDFIVAAAAYGIPNTMYLTDVFGGFEIWNGGAGSNLGVDEFKVVVNK